MNKPNPKGFLSKKGTQLVISSTKKKGENSVKTNEAMDMVGVGTSCGVRAEASTSVNLNLVRFTPMATIDAAAFVARRGGDAGLLSLVEYETKKQRNQRIVRGERKGRTCWDATKPRRQIMRKRKEDFIIVFPAQRIMIFLKDDQEESAQLRWPPSDQLGERSLGRHESLH